MYIFVERIISILCIHARHAPHSRNWKAHACLAAARTSVPASSINLITLKAGVPFTCVVWCRQRRRRVEYMKAIFSNYYCFNIWRVGFDLVQYRQNIYCDVCVCVCPYMIWLVLNRRCGLLRRAPHIYT